MVAPMKKLLLALPLAFLFASPAEATGGFVCRTAGERQVQVSVVIGHTAVASVVSATLTDNGRAVPVTVAQSWLDPNEFRLDLVDSNAVRHELRVRTRRNGDTYDGSLWRGGERRWVRCREA
jgi:hypothetical protein